MAIPAQFIDELVARSDIADVISEYVSLTPKGGSLWGLCPFHGEKTPSFHVVSERQMYHCFGCGKGGGVLSFLMDMENVSYPEAIHILAKKQGVTVPEEGGDDSLRKQRTRVLALNKEAARFFHTALYQPDGESGLRYVQGRGLSKGVVTRFGLGYAPNRWDSLLTAMQALGYDKRDLLDAGLAIAGKNGGIYDRFRGRVMFPIIDLRGNVIGFGGRVLDDSTPKYLNSPDTIVFDKSQNLFALNLAKTTKLGRIVLTEGYMDTISLYQAGFDCAVASLGTSLTAAHARLLSRYTKEVVIAYDADTAGVSAAQRAIPLLEKTGLKVRVLRMHGAKDPDEYIQKYGRDSFYQLLERSENYVEYNLEQIQRKYTLTEDVQKIEFAREAATMVAGLTSPAERDVYTGRIAATIGISREAMAQEVKRAYEGKMRQIKKKQERKDLLPSVQAQPKARELRYENVRSARAEEGVIRLLMLDDTLFREVETLEPIQFSSAVLRHIFVVLSQRKSEGRSLQLGTLSDELGKDELELLVSILQQPESLANGTRVMNDYRRIMETERMKGAGKEDEAALLAAREKYREKKAMEDGKHG